MFGIDFEELIVLLILALILFGPDKLPEYAQKLAQWTARIRQAGSEVTNQIRSLTIPQPPPHTFEPPPEAHEPYQDTYQDRFCHQCGHHLQHDYLFCPHCGHRLKEDHTHDQPLAS